VSTDRGRRRLRILEALVGAGAPELGTTRLCQVSSDVVGVSGAGIMLVSDGKPSGSAGATDDVSAALEQLQFDLGEGPCMDAHHRGEPVLEPDLAEQAVPRWPAFTAEAVDAGAAAVFAFPLRVGVVRLGSLDLYCDRPGALSDAQHADALVVADIAAETLLVMQAGASPGMLATELAAGGSFHGVVHQASGMVAVQLEVDVGEALVRLRAHAFGNGRHLADVAADVVARRLRFDAGGDGGPQ
jgi:hypothetical protein